MENNISGMEKRVFRAGNGRILNYILFKNGIMKDGRYPVIVYLHGTDGCGDDPDTLLEIKTLQSFINNGEYVPQMPMLLVSPQCPKGLRWDDIADEVCEIAHCVCEDEHGDEERVALTGCSLGGMGVFSIAQRHPNVFSCLVPVCASTDPAACKALVEMPVRIFHGSADTGMGFSVVEANDVINACGGKSELIMLEGEGHEIRWIYCAPEYDIVNWMLRQKR